MALAMLRLIGEEARKDRTARVIAEVPVEVATYLINEKREWLRTLEDKSDVELIIVPNLNIDTPEYSIRRVRDDELEQTEFKRLSYQMPTPAKVADPAGTREQKAPQEPPAVATFLPTTPAPIVGRPDHGLDQTGQGMGVGDTHDRKSLHARLILGNGPHHHHSRTEVWWTGLRPSDGGRSRCQGDQVPSEHLVHLVGGRHTNDGAIRRDRMNGPTGPAKFVDQDWSSQIPLDHHQMPSTRAQHVDKALGQMPSGDSRWFGTAGGHQGCRGSRPHGIHHRCRCRSRSRCRP
jgi:hypothetical protein